MSTLYLVSSNGKIAKEGDVLVYRDHTGLTKKFIPEHLDLLVVIGDLEWSSQALNLLFQYQIPVYFLRKNGRTNGRLVFSDNKNTLLRHQQHMLAEDEAFVNRMALQIVKGKVQNEYLFMQRLSRKYPDNQQILQAIGRMQTLKARIDSATNTNEVRGYEGLAAKEYFQCIGQNLLPSWAKFTKRTKNPPKDKVNAVLSFLYTVLASKLDTFIQEEGLDDSVGSLHDFSYGRRSLVFDLIEEFRTPLVDTTVCSLINELTLKEDSFRSELIEDTGENGVFLTIDGMRKTLSGFEKKLEQTHKYPLTGQTLTYQEIMHKQVQQYKQVVCHLKDQYEPFIAG